MSLRAIPPAEFRLELEGRLAECEGDPCPTVLGGPTHPDLCAACQRAFERAGITTSDEQLRLKESA